MVDFFLVLLQPGAGDELQGIKKGILELADALVVNKADGDQRALAERTRARARARRSSSCGRLGRLDAAGARASARDGAGDRRALGDASSRTGPRSRPRESSSAPAPAPGPRLDVEPGPGGPATRVPGPSGRGRRDPGLERDVEAPADHPGGAPPARSWRPSRRAARPPATRRQPGSRGRLIPSATAPMSSRHDVCRSPRVMVQINMAAREITAEDGLLRPGAVREDDESPAAPRSCSTPSRAARW